MQGKINSDYQKTKKQSSFEFFSDTFFSCVIQKEIEIHYFVLYL